MGRAGDGETQNKYDHLYFPKIPHVTQLPCYPSGGRSKEGVIMVGKRV